MKKLALCMVLLVSAYALSAEEPAKDVLDAALSACAKEIEKNLQKGDRIVVSGIETTSDNLSVYLTDGLTYSFYQNRKVSVADRKNLDKVYEELNLNKSEFFDPKTAVVAGKMMGAQYIVTGSCLNIGQVYRLHITANKTTATGEICAEYRKDIPKNTPFVQLITAIEKGTIKADPFPDIYANDADKYFAQALVFLGQYRFDMAKDEFTKVIGLAPDYIYAYQWRAVANFQLGHHDEALNDVNKVINLYENYNTDGSAYAYQIRGELYAGLGLLHNKDSDLYTALRDFDRAISLNPKQYEAYIGKGIVHIQLNDYRQAEKAFNDAVSLQPDIDAAYMQRADFYFGQKRYDLAEKDFKYVLQLHNNKDSRAFYLLGQTYLKQNRYDLAEKNFKAAYDLDKNIYNYNGALSELSLKKGDTRKALEYLDKLIAADLQKQAGAAYILRTAAHLKNGSISAARADYEQFLAITKSMSMPVKQLARMIEYNLDYLGSNYLDRLYPKAATYLTASAASVSFSYSGGSRTITLNTDGASWDVSSKPSWVSVSKSGNSLTLTCTANSGGARAGEIKVKADSREANISIMQEAPGRFTVKSIEFGNTDDKNSILNVYGSAMYASDMRFLTARIACSNTFSSAISKTLYIKVINPDGTLKTGTNSPTGYSFKQDIRCEGNQTSQIIQLTGWGKADGGSYSVGTYGYEVWCDGERLYRVSVALNKKPNEATYLQVNNRNSLSISFSASGGTQTVSVSTDCNSYDIKYLPSWCRVSKGGTSFTLTCEANDGDSRSDWFKVIAGTKEVRIDVSQERGIKKIEGEIENIWIDFNVVEYGRAGMRIHVAFSVDNMKNKRGACNAYFYFANGGELKDYNGNYKSANGQVSIGSEFTPGYESARFSDFTLFMPYEELHVIGNNNLKLNILLFEYSAGSPKKIAESGYVSFFVTYNPPVQPVYPTPVPIYPFIW